MNFLITILSFTIAFNSYAQKAAFKDLKLRSNSKNKIKKEIKIVFPIVTTSNSKIDNLINGQILNDVLHPKNENQPLKKVLREYINENGLKGMSYEITYNNYNFLSLSITAYGCGSYCYFFKTYFNFDLLTGNKISITDVILNDKIDSFKNIVQADKTILLNMYKMKEGTLKENNRPTTKVDDDCLKEISIETFVVSSNSIEIVDNCLFFKGHESNEPAIKLKYAFTSIEKILTAKFKEHLSK